MPRGIPVKTRCFELFEKHPRMSVAALSDRYGIPQSTLYNNKRLWNEETGATVIERPVIEHKVQFSTATFILGVALGAALTILLAIFGA